MTIASAPVRAKRLKSIAFALLTSRFARWLIGLWFGDTVPFRGTRIKTASRGSFEAPLLLAGIYERAEIDFVHRHIPTTQRVIELGASLGGNSCQIARTLAPGVPMLCVEANPEIVGILRENIARNCGTRPVEVLHGMIGDAPGEGILEIGGSTLASGAGHRGVRTARVPMYSLAEVVDRIGADPYSLVADIEGAEVAFLTVNREALARCTVMIIECHATEFRGRRYARRGAGASTAGWRVGDGGSLPRGGGLPPHRPRQVNGDQRRRVVGAITSEGGSGCRQGVETSFAEGCRGRSQVPPLEGR
jgi:FkbM family methyltransferase